MMSKHFKKRFFITILIIAALAIFMSYAKENKHLSADEAMQMMKSDSNVVIVDVRTKEEYTKKHIPGSILVPIADIREGKLDLLPDKNQTLLLYCWTGRRAEDAAAFLTDRGYTNVYEFGGLIDWTGDVEGEEVNK